MQDIASVFLSVWFLHPSAGNPALPEGLRRVLPGVHSVVESGENWEVRSAGISLDSFGALEANAYEAPMGARQFVFTIPRVPRAAASPDRTPLGVIGAFVNGKPIYNAISTVSYNGQGIWHRDAVRDDGTGGNLLTKLLNGGGQHPPIIGFALDGYPIYGPFAVGAMRSSYRLRSIRDRTSLPDGTRLTTGQYGPPISVADPLGTFVEDFEYVEGSGDLDAHNGRYGLTPAFPKGSYAYYLSTTAQGELSYPYLVGPSYYGVALMGAPEELRFAVKGPDGRNQRFPEIVHEKPMHLILVSEDMQDFMHVHPELGAHDEFGITPIFPRAMRWHAFAQSTPAGGVSQVEHRVIHAKVGQTRALAPVPTITVKMEAPELVTGKDLRIRFVLSDATTGEPVTDLEPYLGAWGHFILISQDKESFIHAHPMEAAGFHDHTMPLGPSPATIEIVTGFDKPGRYRLWAQFRRGGTEVTVPFGVDVRAGGEVVREGIPAGATLVRVSDRGYMPAEVVAKVGETLQLAFRREGNANCGGKVVFPELGISRDLPAGEVVLVVLPAMKTGTYRFSCGMGMYKGAVVVRTQ